MAGLQKSIGNAVRIAVAALCVWGAWQSLQFARADFNFRQDTPDSIRRAIRLDPDGWAYYMRLAQFDPAHAEELLSTSLSLNPYNAQADIELGLQFEAQGDFARAEKQMLEAFRIDNTYLPRWTLANFYLRRDDLPRFWEWARSAAAMPADDIGALLDLCWRVAPAPDEITAHISNSNPQFLRQYINFLSNKNQPAAAAGAAAQLTKSGDTNSDLQALLMLINRLVAVNQPAPAQHLWEAVKDRHWVIADSSMPNNAGFLRAPVPVSFDWSLPDYSGLHSWPGPSGLEVELNGSEPEDAVIAEQFVFLKPGDYSLDFRYHTSGIPPGTGIRWQIVDPVSLKVIAESSDLSSADVKQSEVKFTVGPDNALVLLRLHYQRTLGTVRLAGNINVSSVQIQPRSNS